jgi:hypothetical protein
LQPCCPPIVEIEVAEDNKTVDSDQGDQMSL